MSKPFTTDQPRYFVMGENGEHLSVHKNKHDAFIEAISMAFECPDCNFLVIKRVDWQDEQLFSFSIGLKFKFSEAKDVMLAFIEAFQKRLKKVDHWK
jgi:hypothetical protein